MMAQKPPAAWHCEECPHHENIEFQLKRLTMRMDRVEIYGMGAIISVLVGIIAQLWMISDLPQQLRYNSARDRVTSHYDRMDENKNNEDQKK